MKKNGFTLVELMIVVVIIGVLAAVAMPRFNTAADKAKAAEAPPILSAIAGAQEAHRVATGEYRTLELLTPANANMTNFPDSWRNLGLSVPEVVYFNYGVTASAPSNSDDRFSVDPLVSMSVKPTFTAVATLVGNFTQVRPGAVIGVRHDGGRCVSQPELGNLIPSFGAIPGNCP